LIRLSRKFNIDPHMCHLFPLPINNAHPHVLGCIAPLHHAPPLIWRAAKLVLTEPANRGLAVEVVAILVVERGEHHCIYNLLDKRSLQSTILIAFLKEVVTFHVDVYGGFAFFHCAVFVGVFDVGEFVFIRFARVCACCFRVALLV
jgi:hypothetical protein